MRARSVINGICCISAICAVNPSIAKDKATSEPQFLDVIAQWIDSTNSIIELPREVFEVKLKVKALGYGGGESQLIWHGYRCPYRISSLGQPKFIVRVASQRNDPRGIIQFYKVDSFKDSRKLVVAKAGLFTSGKSVINSAAVDFDAQVYAESSFIFNAKTRLGAGEYVVSTTTSSGNSSFCFGID